MATECDSWSSSENDVITCNRHMLEREVACDVTFVLRDVDGSDVTVGAHTYMLMARSPVFLAMFNGPIAESRRRLMITDVTPDAFKAMLRFIYCDECPLTMDNIFSLLYVAKKYLLTSLERRCMAHLVDGISPGTVCLILEHDFLYPGHEAISERCWRLVQMNTREVLASGAFYRSSRDTVMRLLQCDKLSITEVELFHACLAWATKQCEDEGEEKPSGEALRAALGDVLYLLRLPSLSIRDFTERVLPTGVLNMEEENAIYRQLNAPGHMVNGKLPFPLKARQVVTFECHIDYASSGFSRQSTTRIGLGSGFVHRSQWSMTFTVDKDVIVNALTFHGEFKGKVTLVQNGVTKAEAESDEPMKRIKLTPATLLEPGSFTVSSEGAYTYSGDYFSKPLYGQQPAVDSDDDSVRLTVRDFSSFCFITSISYSHSDRLHFNEEHFT